MVKRKSTVYVDEDVLRAARVYAARLDIGDSAVAESAAAATPVDVTPLEYRRLMAVSDLRDHVATLRALHAAEPGSYALALVDQLSKLSIELGFSGEHGDADAAVAEAFAILEFAPDPATLAPGEALRYATLASSLAASVISTAPPDVDASVPAALAFRALALADRAVGITQALAHLAGQNINQPRYDPRPLEFDVPARAGRRRRAGSANEAGDVFARPARGWGLYPDWTVIHSHALHNRARLRAALGHRDWALDDAIAALAVNLLGTELDFARHVAGASGCLATAALLISGAEPEGGPLGW